MRTKLGTYALAGVLGLTGVAGATLVSPVMSYAATGDSTAVADRVTSIQQALAGLVSDGTLTQAQADEVATTLAEKAPMHGPGRHGRHGGRGMHLADAVEALGITREELRVAAEDGMTLAELGAENGVSDDDLVAALVAAHKEKLDAAVADGRLTQEAADERLARAEVRISEHLDDPIRHPGHRGHGPHGPHGAQGPHGAPQGDDA